VAAACEGPEAPAAETTVEMATMFRNLRRRLKRSPDSTIEFASRILLHWQTRAVRPLLQPTLPGAREPGEGVRRSAGRAPKVGMVWVRPNIHPNKLQAAMARDLLKSLLSAPPHRSALPHAPTWPIPAD
jgi:hypothetical protein